MQKFSVWLPVMGVQLDSDLSIGPVRLRHKERVAKSRAASVVLKKYPPPDPYDAWAVVDVMSGDSNAAFELAEYQVQLALDVVNLYAGGFEGARGSAAYRPGIRALHRSVTLLKALGSSAIPRLSTVGTYPLRLRPMNRFPLYRHVARLISITEKLTDAEERLLAAIRWIGRGAVSPWNEQAFLCFIVAMEALVLGPNKNTDLTYRFKTRITRLVARKGHEEKVLAAVNRLYGSRSAIVHRGSLKVDEDNRSVARAYATMAVFALLRLSKFTALPTHDAIDRWFLEKDLGLRK
jgi:hypothetical protein